MTAAVCLIVGMIVSSGRVPKAKVFFGDWLILMFLFTIVVLTSCIVGVGSTNYGISLMDKMVKMTIFLVCFVRMGGTRRNFRLILWAMVFGSLMIGNDAYNANIDQFYEGRLNSVGGVDFRDSSGLAAHLASMLPLIGVILLTTRQWMWRAPALIAAVLTVNTIVLCRTRSAFVGLLAGVVVAIFLAPRRRRGVIYGAMCLGLAGAFYLTDGHFWNRMQTVLHPEQYNNDSAIQARVELWTTAGRMFMDHPLGVGIGQFKMVVERYDTGEFDHAFGLPRRVTHNTYLLCATELGFHGLLIFLLLIVVSLLKLRRCMVLAEDTDDPGEARLLTYGCLLSLTIYLVAAGFTDRLYTESLWWVAALPVCLERALAQEAEARSPSPVLARREPVDLDLEWKPRPGLGHGRDWALG